MESIKEMTEQELQRVLEQPSKREKEMSQQVTQAVGGVRCVCGNPIVASPYTKEVKCFTCNRYHIKWFNGKWKREQHTITRETLTPATCATITYKSLRGNKEALAKMNDIIISIKNNTREGKRSGR